MRAANADDCPLDACELPPSVCRRFDAYGRCWLDMLVGGGVDLLLVITRMSIHIRASIK